MGDPNTGDYLSRSSISYKKCLKLIKFSYNSIELFKRFPKFKWLYYCNKTCKTVFPFLLCERPLPKNVSSHKISKIFGNTEEVHIPPQVSHQADDRRNKALLVHAQHDGVCDSVLYSVWMFPSVIGPVRNLWRGVNFFSITKSLPITQYHWTHGLYLCHMAWEIAYKLHCHQ